MTPRLATTGMFKFVRRSYGRIHHYCAARLNLRWKGELFSEKLSFSHWSVAPAKNSSTAMRCATGMRDYL